MDNVFRLHKHVNKNNITFTAITGLISQVNSDTTLLVVPYL